MMMLHFYLKPALLLTLLFILPIVAIRAQPYQDHVIPALIDPDCPMPCFMGIRPGVTTMRESAEILDADAWVANAQADFPKEFRDAPFFDSVLRKATVNWRWSEALPSWIIGEQRGSMTVQDVLVLDISVGTRLMLGEIFLAFGDPTEAHYFASKDGKHFEYIGWYAESGMVIITLGDCPFGRVYNFQTQIVFSRISPDVPLGDPKASICK